MHSKCMPMVSNSTNFSSSSLYFRLSISVLSSMHTFYIVLNKLSVIDSFAQNFMFLARDLPTSYSIHHAGPIET